MAIQFNYQATKFRPVCPKAFGLNNIEQCFLVTLVTGCKCHSVVNQTVILDFSRSLMKLNSPVIQEQKALTVKHNFVYQ